MDAYGSQKINLQSFSELPWARLITHNTKLKFYLKLNNGPWSELAYGISNELILNHALPHSEFWISNLAPFPQTVSFFGATSKNLFMSEVLEAYETKKWSWKTTTTINNLENNGSLGKFINKGSEALVVVGKQRISGIYMNSLTRQSFQIPARKSTFTVSESTGVRFLLTNSAQDESFVVNFSDTKQIEQAREQIKNPISRMPRMLIAQVVYARQF